MIVEGLRERVAVVDVLLCTEHELWNCSSSLGHLVVLLALAVVCPGQAGGSFSLFL